MLRFSMMNPQLDDLLYTLDLCADSLPFDLLTVHVQRIETIKEILTEARPQRTPAKVLHLCPTPKDQRPELKD